MSASAAPTPARSPPPGEHTDFINPPSIQPAIIGGLTICLAISTICVVIRTYAQWSLFKKLVWADFWLLLGWMFQVPFCAFLYACLPYGGGHHIWDVTKQDYAEISFLLFIDYILYGCAILGAKMSIFVQLIGIFVPRGRNLSASVRIFYWASVFLMAVNFIYYIAHNIALIFQCDPIEKGWDPVVPGHCINQQSLLFSSAPFNIISDFLMILLPLPIIFKLKLPLKTRLQISSAFTIGIFGCICSAVRLYYTNRLSATGDSSWLNIQNQMWANAEVTTATLIASVIVVPRFLHLRREKTTKYDYPTSSSGGTFARKGKIKSMGSQSESNYTQRMSYTDPYKELEGGLAPIPSMSSPLYEGSLRSPESNQGIMRTVQIDSVQEQVTHSAYETPNVPHASSKSEETGNRTCLYSDTDSDGL